MAKALKKPQPMSSVDRFFANASFDGALAQSGGEIEAAGAPEAPSEVESVPPVEAATKATILEPPPAPRPAVTSVATRTIEATKPVSPHIMPAREQPTSRGHVLSLVQRTGEPVDRQREFQLTRTTDETLEDLIVLYKRATGADLTRSHVLRAVLKAVAEQMPHLKRTAANIGPLRRPSNAKGFEEAREEFEEAIKEAFLHGMRTTVPGSI
jgi:hypothetical protein